MYWFLKKYIGLALHLYFTRIEVHGKKNIPTEDAVLFLPNHQKALIDVLLIATTCVRKPFFLTRSDVFKNKYLRSFFNYLGMLPVYRMRDGRKSLANNKEVFEKCVDIFEDSGALLMFPEGNHNLNRRVRNLSKGFTRLVFDFLRKDPKRKLYLTPVGLNYASRASFPESVAIYYGKSLEVNKYYAAANEQESARVLKTVVFDNLKELTTHIEDEENYLEIESALRRKEISFLNPIKVNAQLKTLKTTSIQSVTEKDGLGVNHIFKVVFALLNLPLLLFWWLSVKPKVWEPEFLSTIRFAYSLVMFPVYFLFLSICMGWLFGCFTGILVPFLIFIYNIAYVKIRKQ